MEHILVYGASGVQGGAVARLLIKQGFTVRTITRSEDHVVSLREQGIDARIGDMNDLNSLLVANEGVDQVFLNLPIEFNSSAIESYTLNAVEAAKRAAVKRIVINTNGFLPEQPASTESLEIKRNMIELVKKSGIPWIVVRPTLYMENLLIPGVVGNHVLAYPIPADKPIPWINAEDAAQFHVYALSHPELTGRTIYANGAEALTGNQLAAQFTEALGRDIQFHSLAYDQFEAGLAAVMGAEQAAGVAGFYRWIGDNIEELLTRNAADRMIQLELKLTTIQGWIKRADIRPAFTGSAHVDSN